ncbi:MAG: sulfatase-like hydrolase/transferase [Phycisphaerales bacterium]|nr:sulfatase-like hydrolase/transferase [Phycisphaerales bacterium]
MLAAILALAIIQPPAPAASPNPQSAISNPQSTASPVLGAKTKNVFLVMSDGLRWQEVFTGADERLIHKDYGVTDDKAVREHYWRDTPEERRKALMPFVWSTVADPKSGGQLYGNLFKNSSATVANPHKVSYPGYSELFCGFTQEGIKDNKRLWNPHATVFEWLHNKPAFKGKVAAFGAWDLFPWIFNTERCGFPVDDGLKPITFGKTNEAIATTNTLRTQIARRWSSSTFDALLFRPAFEWIKLNKPRVAFIGLGETDEWAHENKYEQYLDSARRADAYVKELWDWCQATPEYKDATTIIFTCDHGRGGDNAPGYVDGQLKHWSDHNANIIGAEQTWIMIIGPDTPPRGEVTGPPPLTQSQIAATIAALLGHDYNAQQPRAAQPIPGAIAR